MHSFGILLAFMALVGWGFGDFFIQKASRRIGAAKALFFITCIGSLVLLPFVAPQLPEIFAARPQIWFLVLTSALGFFPAILYFEGLKRGKLTVVEPVLSLELPITIGLSLAFLHEHVSLIQSLAIVAVFIGIILVVTKHLPSFRAKASLERGALFGLAGAFGLGLGNFVTGVFSQSVGPLVTVWFSRTCFAVYAFALLAYQRETTHLFSDFRKSVRVILTESAFDLTAWLSFAFATTLIPISIATTISETYIALAVLLGILVNHEKIRRHQAIGICLAVVGAVVLAYLS